MAADTLGTIARVTQGKTLTALFTGRSPSVYSPAVIPNEDRPGRLAVLDGLRLIAALMVVLYHFTGFEPGVRASWGSAPPHAFPEIYAVTSYGWLGVDLFFIISGFVICMSGWGRTVGGFFRSRVTRLFPAYWAAVILTTAVLWLWPAVRHPLHVTDVLVNLTMLNHPVKVPAVDGVYWTLWAEARFYLLFAVALLWRGQITYNRTLLFGYAWTIASVVAVSSNNRLFKVVFQPEYSPLFIAGVAFFLLHKFGSDIRLWGLIGVSFALAGHNTAIEVEKIGREILGRDLNAKVALALVALSFVAVGVVAMGWTSRVRWRWLSTAGLLTYPLYLLHQNIGWTAIHGLRGALPRWLALAVVVAGMLIGAWLLHRLVEKPMARWLKIRLERAAITAQRRGSDTSKYEAPNRPVNAPKQRDGVDPAVSRPV